MKFFSFLRKGDEKETVQSSPLNLKFEKEESEEDKEKLDNIIKSFNLNEIANYQDYLNLITKKCNPGNNKYQSELDYLYQKKSKIPKQNEANINKMKEIGKINQYNQTNFDPSLSGQNVSLTCDSLKIESNNSFLSLKTNNCVISGKWCYEVTLLTSGIMQIGFAQIITPFSRHSGVGDDETSFSFDGCRKVKWNKERKEYGKIWDIGDVIGVCLDMDKGTLEYFLNGISLGIAFSNIPKGENIALFPAISLSRGESCLFNFGQIPFKYEYKNYQPFDTPLSKVNKVDSTISDLLNLWKKNIFPLIFSNKISKFQNLLLTFDIFNFVSQHICDSYIFREKILPFLIDLMNSKKDEKDKKKLVDIFITSVLKMFSDHEVQKEVGYYIFEHLSIAILEKSLRMGTYSNSKQKEEFNIYENLMALFILLLKCDMITNLLFEKGTLEIFRNVFNCNWFHIGDIMDYLYKKYNKSINNSSMPLNKIIKEIKKDLMLPKDKYYYEVNEMVSKKLSELIYLLLTDSRKLFEGKILKDKFNELIRSGYSIVDGNEVVLNILGLRSKLSNQGPVFLRNIFMNLIYMFDSRFLNMDFDKITTSPWFYRSDQNAIYYDEVGIGGTISHVTTEYSNLVGPEYIIKSDDFSYDFFHKLIHMCNDLFINTFLKKFEEFYLKSKTTPISLYMKLDETGTTEFSAAFRKYFYIYPTIAQNAIYKMAFFIIKFLMYLIKKNSYIIYFIPTLVTEIPFSFFKLLLNLKSRALFDIKTRAALNKSSKHFENDDFVKNIVEFYLTLFADDRIRNPELKESLLKKVNFLLEKKIIEEYYDDNELIFESLIKGLLKDIKGDALCHSASRILLKLISPICFGYKVFSKNSRYEKKIYVFNTSKNEISNNKDIKVNNQGKNSINVIYKFKDEDLVEKLKKYFQGNFKVLEEFLKSYSSILNKVMTNYSMSLSSIIEIGVSKLDLNNINPNPQLIRNHGQSQSDRSLYQGLSSSYNEMCQLLKIYEFLILIYPNEFLDTNKLNYINFINVLKNISSRVINKPYIDHVIKLISFVEPKINSKVISEKYRLELYQIGLSIAGIFIQIYKLKNTNKNYEEFCKKVANVPDLNIEPYKDFMKMVVDELNGQKKIQIPAEIIKEINTNYKDIIQYLFSLRTVKDLNNEEMDKLISQDKLCILCYEYPCDTELLPCKHKCCHLCYEQYKIDKNICFICQRTIESVNIQASK